MPETNELSSISPSAHHPALFLIQPGTRYCSAKVCGIIIEIRITIKNAILIMLKKCFR
jgi:hypothetical protein